MNTSEIYGTDKSSVVPYLTGALLIVGGLLFMFLGSFFIIRYDPEYPTKLDLFSVSAHLYVAVATLLWIMIVNINPNTNLWIEFSVSAVAGFIPLITFLFCPRSLRFGFYFIGICFGLTIFMYASAWSSNLLISSLSNAARGAISGLIPIAIMLVIAGLTAMINLQAYIVIFTTSFLGAYLLIVGVDLCSHTGFLTSIQIFLNTKFPDRSSKAYHLNSQMYGLLAGVLVSWVVSIGWNIFLLIRHRNRQPIRELKGDFMKEEFDS